MYILRYIAKMNVGKTLKLIKKLVKYQNTVYLNEDNILFYIKYITKFDPHTFYLYIHFYGISMPPRNLILGVQPYLDTTRKNMNINMNITNCVT